MMHAAESEQRFYFRNFEERKVLYVFLVCMLWAAVYRGLNGYVVSALLFGVPAVYGLFYLRGRPAALIDGQQLVILQTFGTTRTPISQITRATNPPATNGFGKRVGLAVEMKNGEIREWSRQGIWAFRSDAEASERLVAIAQRVNELVACGEGPADSNEG